MSQRGGRWTARKWTQQDRSDLLLLHRNWFKSKVTDDAGRGPYICQGDWQWGITHCNSIATCRHLCCDSCLSPSSQDWAVPRRYSEEVFRQIRKKVFFFKCLIQGLYYEVEYRRLQTKICQSAKPMFSPPCDWYSCLNRSIRRYWNMWF